MPVAVVSRVLESGGYTSKNKPRMWSTLQELEMAFGTNYTFVSSMEQLSSHNIYTLFVLFSPPFLIMEWIKINKSKRTM